MNRVLISQALIALAVALAFLAGSGGDAARAALFGGAITLVTTYLLARRIARAAALAQRNANSGTMALYLGAAQRFALVAGLLILGLGVLKLAPVPLLAALAATHLGFLMVGNGYVETSGTS
jgi:F0F1-type ATP synthase assembly protein I